MQVRIADLGILLAVLVVGCDSKPEPCIPACEGKQCGVDSLCGQSCGSCPSDETCDEETGRCLCVPDCTDRACGPDHCGGSCGECQAPLSCSPRSRCEGEVGQGAACGRGVPGGAVATCSEGLTCLEVVFEPGAMPCSADGDCLAFYKPDWNPVCVAGDCVASVCVEDCAGGYGPDWCPDGFDPFYDREREECLCVPVGAPGAVPLGAACSLGPVNPGAGSCQTGGWCFSPILDAGPSCETDADCEALTAAPGVDCVGERCVFASCAAPCAVDCSAGWEDFQPTDYPCTCLARSAPTQAAGEPCAFGAVNADAGDCIEDLTCLGISPDPVSTPCPDGDQDCFDQFASPLLNPDCVDGGCGVSFCAPSCDDQPCDCLRCFYPTQIEGHCYCIPDYCGDGGSAGDPCPWGEVNSFECQDNCQSGLSCLGLPPDPVSRPCSTDVDCQTFYPESWNVDCVDGGCGMSYCAQQCNAGACDPGYEPFDVNGTCACRPSP